MKIVINKSHSDFSLSHAAIMRYAELSGFKLFVEADKYDDLHYAKVHHDEIRELKRRDPIPWSVIHSLMFYVHEINRNDLNLVRVVEELGSAANDEWSRLKIVEIPDDVDWVIKDYDGCEWIAERHRTWS